jgi:hypothetical protein
MNTCTEGYECIVVDNTVRSNDLSDCIFWYQANINTPSFQLGKQVFWDLDSVYYDEGADDADREDVAAQSRRRAKPAVAAGLVVEKQDRYGLPVVRRKDVLTSTQRATR